MIELVAKTISRYSMFERGQSVGVAVSAGADSVCLLYVLREIAPRFDLRLAVLHVNHMIRGAEADGDESFVRALGAGLGLPVHVERADVPAVCRASGDNLEQAARRVRSEFFDRMIRAGIVDRAATGHTRSDQAETVLFRFLRGSGTAGFSGIRPVTSAGLVRPLIEVERDGVEAWLRERGIPWRDDSSNGDLGFARNRIRHELLPELQRDWNPRLVENLARMAEIARDEEEFWGGEVERALNGLKLENAATNACVAGVEARCTSLSALPRGLARRVVRRAIEIAKGDLRGISFAHVEDVLALAAGRPGHGRCQVPGLDVVRSFDRIRFSRGGAAAIRVAPVPVHGPGYYEPWGKAGACIRLKIKESSEVTVAGNIRSGYNGPYRTAQGHVLDWDRISGGVLTLRGWMPGDQYCPAGHASQTKLKHLFQRARIPVWSRRTWPVLTCGQTILWAARFGPASDYAATANSRRVLEITENSEDFGKS